MFFFSPRKIFCEQYFCWLLTKTNLTRCLLKGFDCFIKLRTSFEPNYQTPQRAVCGRYSMFNATPGTATVCAPYCLQGRLHTRETSVVSCLTAELAIRDLIFLPTKGVAYFPQHIFFVRHQKGCNF